MTGSGAPQRCARYSVCPVKAKPASMMMLFCTGAVTMAANSLGQAALGGPVEHAEHRRGIAGLEFSGLGGHGQRRIQDGERSGRVRTHRLARFVIPQIQFQAELAGARAASSSRSPRQTNSQGSGPFASFRHRSGPTPAGSPEVTAMRA